MDEKPISAKLYATALGCYEPYLNGRRIVDAFFMPFCQNYQKEYQEYDVLDMLHTGRNTLGLITGPETSMAHFSLGSIVSWFFEYLGGIRIRESEPGLSKIVLKPVMVKEIGDFAVKYRTKYGMIETQWHYEGNQAVFTYYVLDGVSVVE